AALTKGEVDHLQVEVVAAAAAGHGRHGGEGVGLDHVVAAEDHAARPRALEDVVLRRVEQGGSVATALAAEGKDLEEVGHLVDVTGTGQVAEGAAAHEVVAAGAVEERRQVVAGGRGGVDVTEAGRHVEVGGRAPLLRTLQCTAVGRAGVEVVAGRIVQVG